MNLACLLNRLAMLCLSNAPRHRRAGIALMVGLASPALIGVTGFAVDASFWVTQHTSLQTATDAAAVKAARDLATTPAISATTLAADALSAANQAVPGQITLTATQISVTQLPDTRQVKVAATIQGTKFFSQIYYPFPVNITASSTAGIAYPLVSTQATCFSADGYNYLYSTGFGAIDTAHSAGLDSFKCGSAPTIPAVYDSYCGGGVLGCSLDLLSAGNFLVPFAIQIGATQTSGGAPVLLTPITNTLTALLGGTSATGGTMTFIGPGSSYCKGTNCTIPAGVYNGGLTIQAGVTATFDPGNFIIENGNLAISTQASIVKNTATFYFGGARPGGFVEYSQVVVNTAPLNSGTIQFTSNATFTSSSIIGTQTSSPLSVAPFAQGYANTQGLLSLLGAPGQNLIGTNFISAIGVCPQAASTCANPLYQAAITQAALLPSLNVLKTLLSSTQIANLISSQGETSNSSITSGITYANGVPTDWIQADSVTSTLSTTPGLAQTLLNLLGLGALSTPQTASQTTTAIGTFAGQTSSPISSCTGLPSLYSATLPPPLAPISAGFTDILQTSGQNGATGYNTMTDSIVICGTTPANITSITPLTANTPLVSSTAAGASTISLLQ
jgi:Flp pilus assembly protein TadG